jgi:hypothetical protein
VEKWSSPTMILWLQIKNKRLYGAKLDEHTDALRRRNRIESVPLFGRESHPGVLVLLAATGPWDRAVPFAVGASRERLRTGSLFAYSTLAWLLQSQGCTELRAKPH